MKKNFKKAFTLAEMLIVLAVIAIMTVAIMYIFQNSNPNLEIVKLKKANSVFASVVKEMANSDKYYKDKDLGLLPTGAFVNSTEYLCKTFAAFMTVKDVNCNNATGAYDSTAMLELPNLFATTIDGVDVGVIIDCACKNNVPSHADIVMADGVSLYILNPSYHFGSMAEGTSPAEENRLFRSVTGSKRYKYICLDIDGLNTGEDPFGYGLRADGKILLGKRAELWLASRISTEKVAGDTFSCSASPVPPPGPDCVCSSERCDCCETEQTCLAQANCAYCNDECKSCSDSELISSKPTCFCDRCGCDNPDPNNPCPAKTIYITASMGNFCMMQYNVGDDPVFPIPSSSNFTVVTTTTGTYTNCTTDGSDSCCWLASGSSNGNTANPCSTTNGDYSACKRTVCSWRAANEICSNVSYYGKTWALPTNAQLEAIQNSSSSNYYSVGLGNNGLMFCDEYSGYNSSTCTAAYLLYQAPLVNDDALHRMGWSHYIWGEEVEVPDGYARTHSHFGALQHGTFFHSTTMKTYPASVRCVTPVGPQQVDVPVTSCPCDGNESACCIQILRSDTCNNAGCCKWWGSLGCVQKDASF